MRGRKRVTYSAWIAAASAAVLMLCATTSAGTFSLHLAIPWAGADAPCPSGYSSTTECHPHNGGPVAIRGVGFVSQEYLAPVETAPVSCPTGNQQILGYLAQLVVKGRGTISLSVDASSHCAEPGTDLLNTPQSFKIVGGTGVFAGASGDGVISRTDTGFNVHGFGTDHWEGTITAPAWDAVDLTPPRIRGATNKTVRAPRTAQRVRVKYRVTATDNADGNTPVRCKPASGSRFRVGHRTRVRCTATDLSANTARATFLVIVRRR